MGVAVLLCLMTGPTLFARDRIEVIDGDTLEFGGRKIRLEGIDAPEKAQKCTDRSGATWPCGKAATSQLKALIGSGRLHCDRGAKDGYGRWLATCHVRDRNINAAMVSSGYAMAFVKYSARYIEEESEARRARAGLWRGEFEAPWTYRARRWKVGTGTAPDGCPIKGNISERGKIYHTPWSPHYNRTRINETRGERWFCSESEALAAGWRAPSS